MGKGMRLKEERAIAKPKVIGTIAINLLSDGGVNVSGPLTDPGLVSNAIGKMVHALIKYYTQQAKEGNEKRIITL